ncbi:hypothetical protein LCGC14_0994610 [marine sediment metagenome]|uniref:Metallopeptidase domain-containing protein n=1 Tax=marine sediment metagenome TaxID=412755 RepID=A0A0F9N4U8_9ZZZZ
MIDSPFYGHIALQLGLSRKEDLNPKTMATDGYKLYWHPEFIAEIPEEQLKGVIAHEVMHLVLMHLTRRQSREPKRFNIATDYAVNDLVLKEFELPEWVLKNPDFANKSAEWIYNQIPEQEPDSIVITLDSHEEWGQGGDDGDGDDGDGDGGSDANGAGGLDGLEQRIKELVATAAGQARNRGKLPGHLKELIDGVLQPKLNWKLILEDMICSQAKTDYTLFPANKKYLWRGIYLPGITGTEINIAVVIDISGSTADWQQQFLSEIKGICDSYDEYTIFLMTCDAKIQEQWELHPFEPFPKVHDTMGGTDFRPPFEEAQKYPFITSLVYLTDGYGPFPDVPPTFGTIWVSITDVEYPFGMVIRLPEKQ